LQNSGDGEMQQKKRRRRRRGRVGYFASRRCMANDRNGGGWW